MPRKKIKHQFRRGNEQKYLKSAVLHGRSSSGIHIPLFPLMFCVIATMVVFTASMYTSSIAQILGSITIPAIAFPEVNLPEITFPEIHAPTIALPDLSWISIAIEEFISNLIALWDAALLGIQNIGLSLGSFFSSVFFTFVSYIYTTIGWLGSNLVIGFMFLSNGLLVGLNLWKDNFFVLSDFIFMSYIQSMLFLYTTVWIALEAILLGAFIIGIAVYTFILQIFHFIAFLALMTANSIVAFFGWVGSGFSAIFQVIGKQIDGINKAVSPITGYVGYIFNKTVNEFGGGLVRMYSLIT